MEAGKLRNFGKGKPTTGAQTACGASAAQPITNRVYRQYFTRHNRFAVITHRDTPSTVPPLGRSASRFHITGIVSVETLGHAALAQLDFTMPYGVLRAD